MINRRSNGDTTQRSNEEMPDLPLHDSEIHGDNDVHHRRVILKSRD